MLPHPLVSRPPCQGPVDDSTDLGLLGVIGTSGPVLTAALDPSKCVSAAEGSPGLAAAHLATSGFESPTAG